MATPNDSCIRDCRVHCLNQTPGIERQRFKNLNFVRRLDELLAPVFPTLIIVSLSGFTQDIYERGHGGGKIESRRRNMRLIARRNGKLIQQDGGGSGADIQINFHIYKDNQMKWR